MWKWLNGKQEKLKRSERVQNRRQHLITCLPQAGFFIFCQICAGVHSLETNCTGRYFLFLIDLFGGSWWDEMGGNLVLYKADIGSLYLPTNIKQIFNLYFRYDKFPVLRMVQVAKTSYKMILYWYSKINLNNQLKPLILASKKDSQLLTLRQPTGFVLLPSPILRL